jgi:hypothetical protein
MHPAHIVMKQSATQLRLSDATAFLKVAGSVRYWRFAAGMKRSLHSGH